MNIPVCVIIVLAVTNGAYGIPGRRLTRPKTLADVGGNSHDVQTETAATTDIGRGQTRPKLLDASDDVNGDVNIGGSRKRRGLRPKRSTDTGVLAPARDVLQKLGILTRMEARSESLKEKLNNKIRNTMSRALVMWREYCNRDGRVFDPQRISCEQKYPSIDKKAWGNPGVLPGK